MRQTPTAVCAVGDVPCEHPDRRQEAAGDGRGEPVQLGAHLVEPGLGRGGQRRATELDVALVPAQSAERAPVAADCASVAVRPAASALASVVAHTRLVRDHSPLVA